jgi:hypothetical protein
VLPTPARGHAGHDPELQLAWVLRETGLIEGAIDTDGWLARVQEGYVDVSIGG